MLQRTDCFHCFSFFPRSGGKRGKKEKKQTQILQDETLKSGLSRTSDNLWLVTSQGICFIYFIIWALWTVTQQKCHGCKIEAQFSKPFYLLHIWNIYSGDTLQGVAGNAELGIWRPRCNSSLPWTCLCKLLTPLTWSAPITTSKTVNLTHDFGHISAEDSVCHSVSLKQYQLTSSLSSQTL